MEFARIIMDPKHIEVAVKSIVRFLFVVINNLYCIPVHVLWLILLQPVQYFSEDLYWKIEGMFFRWLLSMVAMWSYSAGYHIVELGDEISDLYDKRAVILFNHQSTADVPLIMAAMNSKPKVLDNILWIMDKQFKMTNFGIVSIGHGDFFIEAGKQQRDASLALLKEHLKSFYIPRKRNWIVLFPEGGFLSNRKNSSQKYAEKNGLPYLRNVNYPRVGALQTILDKTDNDEENSIVQYIIDVTIAYPKGNPLDLLTLVTGWMPSCNVAFYYKKYNIEEIPCEEDALTQWLYNLYIEKDRILQTFYDTGNFPDAATRLKTKLKRVKHDPMEFVLRHLFYLMSAYLWIKAISLILNLLFSFL